MTDIETLKTLTPEQREALVNLIRNSSLCKRRRRGIYIFLVWKRCFLVDHSLTHLQQALVGPQVVHAHNSGLPRLPSIS